MKVVLEIIRATVICLKRENILVKVNFWVMFTIYWAFVNSKRIKWQRFEINVWSHFGYPLYLRKNFVCLSRASWNHDYFFAWQQYFFTEGKLSYLLHYVLLLFSHSFLGNSMVSWEKPSLIKMFYLLTFGHICLYLYS